MFAYFHRHRLILPFAPSAGGALGLGFAALVAVMPAGLLAHLVDKTHLPAVLAVAASPLGVTARVLLVLIGGGALALFAGLGLHFIVGGRTIAVGGAPREGDVPVLRRADAHPDAPPRRPVLAHRDLGAPLLDVPVAADNDRELPLPRDLDQPLAAFDPTAIPDRPREPARALAPLARIDRPQLIDPGDRFETFDLAPLAAPIEPTATIHALLDRLERGVSSGKRAPRSPIRHPAVATDDLHAALANLHGLSFDAA